MRVITIHQRPTLQTDGRTDGQTIFKMAIPCSARLHTVIK